MKRNNKITALLSELSGLEPVEHKQFLEGEGQLLRNNLLTLYSQTSNKESHDVIVDIMSEAGYSWFGKLASAARYSLDSVSQRKIADSDNNDLFMSEDDFLELLPVNGHFH